MNFEQAMELISNMGDVAAAIVVCGYGIWRAFLKVQQGVKTKPWYKCSETYLAFVATAALLSGRIVALVKVFI
jgi:hypothetical protein